VIGEEEVGDEEPLLRDGAGMVENETDLLLALEPERDRFLILDRNREVVPSFFSGFEGPVMVNREDEGPAPDVPNGPGPGAVMELGVAVPEAGALLALAFALLALAWSLNFFW